MADMKFRLSSEFGVMEEVRGGRIHNGIDLAMPSGTELRSIGDGVIEQVVNYGTENIGKGVIVRLEDGTRAIYGHMSDISVKQGQVISGGDIIGLSGNSGHSTGAHLHFGLHNGDYLDPTLLADNIANLSGDLTLLEKAKIPFELSKIKHELTSITQQSMVEKWLMNALETVGVFLNEVIFAVSLVGSGCLIILAVAGWKDGYKWASVLFAVNMLVKYLFGGGLS